MSKKEKSPLLLSLITSPPLSAHDVRWVFPNTHGKAGISNDASPQLNAT